MKIRKPTHLTAIEKVLMWYTDAWVWIAFVPEWRLVPAFVIGKRVQENADLLIERLKAVSCGFIPRFTSDQLSHYPKALLNGYGIPEIIVQIRGEEAIEACLAASTVTQTINTSFVERNNLTCGQGNGRLSRKVLSFSKDLTRMEKHLWLSLTDYHFVLPHSSLAQPLPEPRPTRGTGPLKKSQPVTPAMMAGITDHVWTMEELLSY